MLFPDLVLYGLGMERENLRMRVRSTQDLIQHVGATHMQKKLLKDWPRRVRKFSKHQQELLHAQLVCSNDSLLQGLSVYFEVLLHSYN